MNFSHTEPCPGCGGTVRLESGKAYYHPEHWPEKEQAAGVMDVFARAECDRCGAIGPEVWASDGADCYANWHDGLDDLPGRAWSGWHRLIGKASA